VSEPLFSPSWYRVAALRPRLRSHAHIFRHVYRGERWYVLRDDASGRFHRFSPPAHTVIALMDGNRGLDEIWRLACARLGDDAPTQDEVIQLLARLHAVDLLNCDVPPNIAELARREGRMRRRRRIARFLSPLAVRLPLLDPDRFLDRAIPFLRPLFGPLGATVWLAVIGWAVMLAVIHWRELTANVTDRVLSAESLVLLAVLFPLVKVVHEFGHAFATKVWGGEVHEMGVMFLALMPVPYVNASSASAFREKHRRMIVGAAGMLAELFLAALAMFLWTRIEPGTVRAGAYNVMLIAGVTTILFNANPLVRFDGYYIVSDLLEIPNLSSRAIRYLGYLIQRYAFGLDEAASPVMARGEAPWLGVYAFASFAYRVVIVSTIVFYVATKYFFVGVVIALWALMAILVLPMVRHVRFLLFGPQLRHRRGRALAVIGATLAALGAALWLVPAPFATLAEGVVWIPERAMVRAGADGEILRLVARPGDTVRAGEPLVIAEDPALATRARTLAARVEELARRRETLLVEDRVQAEIAREALETAKAQLAWARARQDELVVRSPAAGRFLVVDPQDLPGRFVRRGELLGYVVDPAEATVRVVVPQDTVTLVRERTRGVSVRLAEDVWTAIPARIAREVPAATQQLPSLALSTEGGGGIALDPQGGARGKAFQSHFTFDLALDAGAGIERYGERAFVRFDHGREPLARQWFRRLRQLFLRAFDV